MAFTLPNLPFTKDALAPYMSAETIEYHYGRHHQTYINNLNQLIAGTEFATKSLEEIVTTATGAIFNNAAQAWNHDLFWNCLQPNSNLEQLSPEFTAAINDAFTSIEKLKEEFTKAALGVFGSGWAWLIKTRENKLAITTTSNANNPLTSGDTPLLACDVWEHSYYIDYRNARAKYLEAFWYIVNWHFVSQNFVRS